MSNTHSAAIEQQVHHLGNEFSLLSNSQAEMQATQRMQGGQIERLADGVDRILDAINAPKPQVQLWTVLGGIATLLAAMGLFVELRLSAYDSQMAMIAAQVKENHTIVIERSEFIGAARERLRRLENDQRYHHQSE